MRQRFAPQALATDRQREFLRQLTTSDNPQAADPALTMNEAWHLAGAHLPCDESDAKILRFFGQSPADFSQSTGADLVDELLGNPVRKARWASHPILAESSYEAVHFALDAVDAWGIDKDLFQGRMQEFDVRRAFEFDAETLAASGEAQGLKPAGIRKLVRQTFIAELKRIAKAAKF